MCHSSESALQGFPSVAGPRSARMLLGWHHCHCTVPLTTKVKYVRVSAPLVFGEDVALREGLDGKPAVLAT